jgi:hypothetical protein
MRKSDGEYTVVRIRSSSIPQHTPRPRRFSCTLYEFPAFVPVSATPTHHIMKQKREYEDKDDEREDE